MKNFLFNLILLLFAGNVCAHQPDVSTTLLSQQDNNVWVLQVKASLTAYEFEVAKSFPEDVYESPEEFRELVIRHVLENISIVFDENQEAILQKPVVKLGHETNVVLEVAGVPENFSKVRFENSSFKDIHRNQSALVILKSGFSQDQFVLNNSNQHTAQLMADGTQFIQYAEATTSKSSSFLFLLAGMFALGLVTLSIYRLKNSGYRFQ